MKIALTVILVLVSLIILVVSLLMSPDSNGFSGALVGSSDLDLFKVSKERGFKKILKWTMFVSGFILLIVALLIRLF
ncbi:preprotein translocase subunit SecG [Mesomycoplasma lagogenitalium]|uniref:Protein-export membrane protein SecG n=1 Tax=Mesomycoplasma lagogenitalium TaxID=171286 RepID=A0ABY8LTZ8_9BACT|nr:preprotein translocase subunit SecG [Mesomycoplasma lagogenitalium]WGI36715.1 preprotein translocase subunit SecG [Mesomycoplasma lagogenitalium]